MSSLLVLSSPVSFDGGTLPSNDSLLWGPYRPNLYFGIRPQIPETVSMGLMWSNADSPTRLRKNLRHTCEQNEGMDGYGWTWYDPRTGGSQTIHDVGNKVDITTDFVKAAESDQWTWALTIEGKLHQAAQKTQKTTLIFYLGVEAETSNVECRQVDDSQTAHAVCSGTAGALSNLNLEIFIPPSMSNDATTANMVVESLVVQNDQVWQAKSIFLEGLARRGSDSTMLHNENGSGNMHFIQMTFEGDFKAGILFSQDTTSPLPFETIQHSSEIAMRAFQDDFMTIYPPQGPFTSSKYGHFSMSMLSNLMGGIGYFYGTSKIDSSAAPERSRQTTPDSRVSFSEPYQLLSAVPSRPFFPRGFLWDEGFHLQLILDWDLDLAVEMLLSWFDLMDEDGWIAREQILGPEARSKVPPEFQTQNKTYANPPIMYMVVEMIFERLSGLRAYLGKASQYIESAPGEPKQLSEQALMLLQRLYNSMRLNYAWFRRTQIGSLEHYHIQHLDEHYNFTEGYRWRGRTATHILTSGFDDYPRATTPSNNELHLDALCWVNMMAKVMYKLADALFDDDVRDIAAFASHLSETTRSLEAIHWSEAEQAYCDTTITSGQIEHVCHRGYISILPLLTGFVCDEHHNTSCIEERLSAILDLISSPEHLWTSHGLRSLSTQDQFYGTGENYWRSPIWININYMALSALLDLAQHPHNPHSTRARHLYIELRKNIVNTVYTSWAETGFAWEQYNPDTGAGQRTQHFTGWTALVVRIMAMPELQRFSIERPPDIVVVQRHSVFSSQLLFGATIVLALLAYLCRRPVARIWAHWLKDH